MNVKTVDEAISLFEIWQRIAKKGKRKADGWIRFAVDIELLWIIPLILVALIPFEAAETALWIMPLVALYVAMRWQPTAAIAIFTLDEAAGAKRTIQRTAGYQLVIGFLVWALPLHNDRGLVVPFIAVAAALMLLKGVAPKWITKAGALVLVGMAVIFISGGREQFVESVESYDAAQTATVQAAPQRTYTSPAPSTTIKAVQTTAKPNADKPKPAVNPVPEPEAILGPRSSVSPEYVEPGSLVHSTIIVDNVSSVEAKNVHVTIELAQGLVFADTGFRVREVYLGNIPGHGEIPINSTLQVAEDAPAGGYDNWVHVRADNYPGISVPHVLTVVKN